MLWVADALAAIHGPASTVGLIRALRDSVARRLDPMSLEPEDVIVNRIANHLAERPAPDVAEALLEALGVRLSPESTLLLMWIRKPVVARPPVNRFGLSAGRVYC